MQLDSYAGSFRDSIDQTIDKELSELFKEAENAENYKERIELYLVAIKKQNEVILTELRYARGIRS